MPFFIAVTLIAVIAIFGFVLRRKARPSGINLHTWAEVDAAMRRIQSRSNL